MANFTSLNGISCDSVSSINGVAKASVNNINGVESCSGHDPGPSATKLYLGYQGDEASWGAVSTFGGSVSDVTTAINTNAFQPDPSAGITARIAYGKDGSGNPLLITVSKRDNNSLFRISASDWAASTNNSATQIEGPDAANFNTNVKIRQLEAAWGNDVWISIGSLKEHADDSSEANRGKRLYRSTDGGTNWNSVMLDDLSNMPRSDLEYRGARGLVTNGLGKWWIAVYDETASPVQSMIYCSEDDGQTWALHHTFTDTEAYYLVYTNDTLVLTYNYTGASPSQRRAVSAAGSATSGASNWGTSVALAEDGDAANDMINTNHVSSDRSSKRIAAGNGRVVCCDYQDVILLIVDGKTITVSGALTAVAGAGGIINQNITSVATDGEGNWYIGSRPTSSTGGDIAKNTNNGDPASWAVLADNLEAPTDNDVRSMAVDRYLPV